MCILLVLPDVPECEEDSGDATKKPGETCSDPTIDGRHYAALNKEQRKTKPNKVILNKYLNVQFPSRRKYLETMAKDDRPKTILNDYPCFKDPCEVSTSRPATFLSQRLIKIILSALQFFSPE